MAPFDMPLSTAGLAEELRGRGLPVLAAHARGEDIRLHIDHPPASNLVVRVPVDVASSTESVEAFALMSVLAVLAPALAAGYLRAVEGLAIVRGGRLRRAGDHRDPIPPDCLIRWEDVHSAITGSGLPAMQRVAATRLREQARYWRMLRERSAEAGPLA
jgi:hypothetical protein